MTVIESIPVPVYVVNESETNISIRTTKRFASWFRQRGGQENLTASKLGMRVLEDWIDRGAPMLTEGMDLDPLQWDPTVDWEKLERKKAPTFEPRAPAAASRRR